MCVSGILGPFITSSIFKLFRIKYNFNLCIWHIMLYLNCQCEKLGEKQQHVKQSTVDGPDQKNHIFPTSRLP